MIISALLLTALATEPPDTRSPGQRQRDADMVAGRICGIDARDNEKLLAELRAKPEMQAMQEDGGFVQLMDSANGTVWAFTVKGGPGYPAVSCSELGPYQGHLVFRQSLLCNSSPQVDCQAFFLVNRQRNARMASELEARLREPQ